MTLEEARGVLGVSPEATADELKRAYWARAKRAHPDANGTDAEFRRVKEAYDTLRGDKISPNGEARKERKRASAKKDKRTSDRALPFDEGLAYMNANYVWVKSPGAVAFIGGGDFEFRKTDGFKISEDNRQIIVGVDENGEAITKPIASWWLKSVERATYSKVGLWPPPKKAPAGAFNLWRGFAVQPRKGKWPLMQTHLHDVIASGVPKIGEYVEKWIAHLFQRPGERAEGAIAMRGIEGIGKSILGNSLSTILGRHAQHVTDAKHFVESRFNAHMASCCFFFADECFWGGDRRHEGTLKGLITEPTIPIEPKGVNLFYVDNSLHLMLSSNNKWIVPAGIHARRFTITDVSPKHHRDTAYFKALIAELDNGGREAMLYDLLALDLGDWHPRETVDSAALRDQKERSLGHPDLWLLLLLDDGDLPTDCGWPSGCAGSRQLREDAVTRVPRLRDVSDQDLAEVLKRIGATKRSHPSGSPRGWKFLPLAQARAKWCEVNFARDWTPREEWNSREIPTPEPEPRSSQMPLPSTQEADPREPPPDGVPF